MLHAAQLARDLRESEARMTLAADAANLGIWIRDLVQNGIWATDKWRALFGFSMSEQLELNLILQRLHPDDREMLAQTLARALEGGGGYGFYDTRYGVWNRNRLAAGVQTSLRRGPIRKMLLPKSQVILDLYYMRQNDSRSETQHVNGIGAALAFYF